MQKSARSIHIHDRLEIYHLEAYFGVQKRTAQKHRKLILDFFNRRTGVLFLRDLAKYDNIKEEELLEYLQRLL
ncbi:MAG: hypothetical protein CMC13_08440 [Flavobacteriaceae bacterium]|nr:hypothetical protein [Flavobacteriaceae bacterium]|tara:strand:- start:478 stop:696 length:219 start_codon:yes stop_codon:yes gene_type:complete